MRNTIDILGVTIDRVTMRDSVEQVLSWIEQGGVHCIVTPNSEMIEAAQHDAELLSVLNGADLVIPDGVGVLHASKILGDPLLEKVPGVELCQHVIGRLHHTGGSVYLLGAAPGVAEKAARNLKSTNPGLVIAGTHDGFFEDDGPVVDEIKKVAPDVLLVCLGVPKQEKWMARNQDRFENLVMIGAGGTLNILAGTAERAPQFYIDHGLEWLYRLKKEPSRIGRMMKLPVFGLKVLKRKVFGK